jgi:hypothetical protein
MKKRNKTIGKLKVKYYNIKKKSSKLDLDIETLSNLSKSKKKYEKLKRKSENINLILENINTKIYNLMHKIGVSKIKIQLKNIFLEKNLSFKDIISKCIYKKHRCNEEYITHATLIISKNLTNYIYNQIHLNKLKFSDLNYNKLESLIEDYTYTKEFKSLF